MAHTHSSDILVIGGGLAGIVTALEALRQGQRVTLVDRDTPERLGGLALWAFGGMALVRTPLQARMKIPDTPERALADWLRFGEIAPDDTYPQQWARYYVEHSRSQVYDWLIQEGVKFMPAVNWVERGMQGNGNSLPRYHIVWGTSQYLTRRMIATLHQANTGNRLTLLSNHEVVSLASQNGMVNGADAINHDTGQPVQLTAQTVVLAMGGINGSHEQARANWPATRPLPATMLNGAHPFANGKLHHLVAGLGGHITHAGEMWNYAAGLPHPQPHFPGHGLSAIPCKSALWLDHTGRRIGPEPLVTGFDTHILCQRVAAQEKPYTWHLLNWRIAAKELALSGAEHNQRVRLRAFCADDDLPSMPSLVDVWTGVNWFEREAFDLYGILFEGHPDLRRILTDYGFVGHAFRKDFPLIGNVEVRYDPEKRRVVYEPVSIEPRVLVPRTIRDDSRYEQARAEREAGTK